MTVKCGTLHRIRPYLKPINSEQLLGAGDHNMDSISAVYLMFGLILLLASWIQLLFVSFRDDFSWGLTSLFAPPLSYLYAFFCWEKAQSSILMAAGGWLLILFSL